MVNIPLFTGFYTSKRWLFGISSINSRDQEFVLGFHINFFHLSTFCFTNSRSWILPSWVTTDSFQRSWSHGWTSTLAMHFKMKGPPKLAAHRSRVIVTRSLKPSYSGNRWVGTCNPTTYVQLRKMPRIWYFSSSKDDSRNLRALWDDFDLRSQPPESASAKRVADDEERRNARM